MNTKFILFSTLSSVAFGLSNTKPPVQKQKVLVVIDVLDGYDRNFIRAQKNTDNTNRWDWIASQHDVTNIYNKTNNVAVTNCATCNKTITYNVGWNAGLETDVIEQVSNRTVAEIQGNHSRTYDQLIFAHDYLDPTAHDKVSSFAVDATGDLVTNVNYNDYLFINAGGHGAQISHYIRDSLPEVTIKGGGDRVHGISTLYFSKQVDNAFTNNTAVIDVDAKGKSRQNNGAETLAKKLKKLNLDPDQAELYFVGILTNMCVQQSSISATKLGYTTYVIEAGVAAADKTQNEAGLDAMKKEGVQII